MLKALGSGVRATKHPLCCRMRAQMEESLIKWSSIPFPDRQGLCPAMNILVKDISLKIQHVRIRKLQPEITQRKYCINVKLLLIYWWWYYTLVVVLFQGIVTEVKLTCKRYGKSTSKLCKYFARGKLSVPGVKIGSQFPLTITQPACLIFQAPC